MSILTWIEEKKRLKVLNAPKYVSSPTDSSKGLWTRCDKCGVILYIKHLKENQRVCFGCSYHLQMMSQERIENLLDKVPAIASLSSSSFGVSKGLGARSPAQAPLRGKSSCRSSSSPFLPLLAPSGHRTAPKKMALAKPLASVALGGKGMVSTWRPLDETVSPCDPLRFHDQKNYTDRLKDAQERTGLQDAIQTGTGMIDGIPVALAVMDFSFMGGSMGSVVGEKVTRLIEYATQEGLTLLIVSASGGARMQEGVFSLMQMAKISSSLQIYQSCAKLLYISILTSPTTGGVTASFAMLGDIIFAEPKALIAFAGRRVIEQTLAEDLPEDFQTSESMLHHGLVDLIVPRRFLRQALSETIRLYQNAPFKKIGIIPFGVQNPITFLTEEKIRRQWGTLTKAGTKEISKNEFKSSTSSNQSTIGSKHPYNANVNLGLQKLQEERRISRSNKTEANVFTAKDFQKNTEYTLEGELSSPSTVYRDILTSFEVMLNLFASGKTKNENISFSVLDQVNPLRAPLGQEGAGSFATKVTKSSLHVPCQSTPFTEGVLGGFANKPFTEGVGAGSKAIKIGKKDGQSALKRGKKAYSKSIKNDGIYFLRVQNGKNSVNLRSFCRAPFFLFLPPLAVPCPFLPLWGTARRGKKGHGTTPQRGSLHHSKAVIDHSGAVMQGKSFDNNKTVIKPVRFKNTDFLQNGDRQKIETSNGTSHIDTTQKIMFRLSKNEFQKHNSYKQDLEKNRVVFKNAQKGQYQKLVKALYQNNLQQIKKLQNENEIMTLPEGAGSFATKDKRDMFCPFFSAWPYNKTDRSLLLHNFRFFSESFVSKNFEESRQGLNFNSLSERFPKRSGVFADKNDNVSSNVIKLADQNADINFLNQAIELAATDSVEWRCFYIHQQLAENIGFLEDFLQQDHDSRKKNGNLLFYKSICRSEKTVAEQSY